MKENKIFLTGTMGLLGQALLSTKFEDKIIPTFHNKTAVGDKYSRLHFLDITEKSNVLKQFKTIKPNFVIHSASIGNVDYCEKNKEEAYKVNVEGTLNILDACKKYNVKLIFISTNAVFDGKNPPYNEKSTVNPINYYGTTKALAEEAVLKSEIDHVIVRLILMYGWNHQGSRDNPVTWLLKKLINKEVVKLVNDTYTNPLYNLQAAQAICEIVRKNKSGIYHIAGKDRVNRYEFGVETAITFGFNKKDIASVSSDYFSGIASRMPDTTYDILKMQNELGIQPLSIKEGLLKMKKAKSDNYFRAYTSRF